MKRPKRCSEEGVRHIKYSRKLSTYNGKKAIFLKGVFTVTEMQKLARFLLEDNEDGWEFKNDKKRGPKCFFITGMWTEQGHCNPGDPIHPARLAGKRPEETTQRTHAFLQPFAERACTATRKHRNDLLPVLNELPQSVRVFQDFPLFMAAEGMARMHKDENDFVSFLFLMKSEGEGGELEIGGARTCFDWKVGDAILLDSALLYHATRKFQGRTKDRVVGLFIIHKSLLRVCGILP